MRDLAQLYKAFSEPVRLEMLVLLARHGELCVCDLEGALGLSQSATSRHLRHLYRAGLAEHRRDGSWVHYRLNEDLPPDRKALLDALLAQAPNPRVGNLDAALHTWLARKGTPCGCNDQSEAP